MPVLFCRDLEKRTAWRVEIEDDSFTAGHSSKVSVPLPDRELEKEEFVVDRQGKGYVLGTLTSDSHVHVNDSRLLGGSTKKVPLKTGDRIRLGKIALVFYERAPDEGAAFPEPPPTNLDVAALPAPGKSGQWLPVLGLVVALGLALGFLLGLMLTFKLNANS